MSNSAVAAPAASAASAAVDAQLAAATFAKLHPKEYHRKFLAHSVRPDGRSLTAFRSTIVAPDSISSCAGSSLVKIGSTSIVCGIKLEVGRPLDTKPQDGRLVVEVHLGPMCSPKFKIGRATEQAVALSQWLTNAIINSHTIHLPDLSIVSNESCWVLYADLVCLNYDGNLYDSCLLALIECLKRLKLPETEIIEDGLSGGGRATRVSEVCISSTNHHALAVQHTLISTTFGIIDQTLIVDPTAAEEDLLSGQFTIVMNEKSALCQFHAPGGVPITDTQMRECMAIAKARVPSILPMIK